MSRSAGASALALLAAAALAVAGDPAPRGVFRPLDPATNPSTPEKVALGAKLFADKRLSKDGTVACATCHVASMAFADGKPTAVGIHGQVTARNTPTILNAALVQPLFWDGRAASLEEQARMPVLNLQEMGMEAAEEPAKAIADAPEYAPLFKAAFGDGPITLQRIARAIACFERTLITGDAPFDRWWAGDEKAMDEPAKRGYGLFIDAASCSQCHSIRQSYALFTDADFHNTGAGKGKGKEDPGRWNVTKKEDDRGAFRTPSLRNVALTAPYMHDGSLATLEEVVDFYVKGGGPNPHLSPLVRPLPLSPQDEKDLVAFLKALTSPVLPQLEECDKLLAEGKPREAFDAFAAELQRSPDNDRALMGLARSAVALDDPQAMETAKTKLRRRVAVLSPEHDKDGVEPVPTLLFWIGRVNQVWSRHDDGSAPAKQEDAVTALRRARDGGHASIECLVLEARMLEEVRSPEEAIAALEADLKARPGSSTTGNIATHLDDVPLLEAWAAVAYRSVWQQDKLTDAARARLTIVGEQLFMLAANGVTLSDESALYCAYAWHRVGVIDNARGAYASAATRETIADKALGGLRNLLAKDLPTFRADLDAIRVRRPDSPAVLLFSGYEALQTGHIDDAERDLKHRLDVEGKPSAATHFYLAEVYAKRGDRVAATNHYAVALALEPNFPKLMGEYETYIRTRELSGFADVDALVADFRQMIEAGPDEPRFQILLRNDLAFTLRDIAASYTARGPARIHTFAEGAPEKAKEILKLCVATYEEAVALIPDDAADATFKRRWDYAAVLNDTGLMHHYFADCQDLSRAEELYLRAFELTQGSYQDSYFYNLQFLYGFELTGRDEKWLELARIAKDAILKEDPKSETGFSPDAFKRTAARRDFERLSAKTGK